MKNLLKGIEPYKKEPDFLSNWIKSSKHVSALNSEREVLKVLKTELIFKRRLDVIQRIYSKFSRLRKTRETKEILEGVIS